MKHNYNVDIIKGVGICLMVLGHCRFPGSHFIYLFHMAVFFIAAGYCFNPKYADSIGNVLTLVKRRLKSLWLPYVLYNTIFLLLHNTFLHIGIMTDSKAYLAQMSTYNLSGGDAAYLTAKDFLIAEIKILCFGAPEPMGGASWFLRILFFVSILYCICEFAFRKLWEKGTILPQMILSLALLGISFAISKTGWTYMNFPTIFAAYILFTGGVIARAYRMDKCFMTARNCICFVAVSSAILIMCNQIGSVNIDLNQYTTPLFLIITSAAGWCLLYGGSYFILKIEWLKKMFVFIGSNTIPILLLHFLCFKVVTLLELKLYNLPPYMLASYPVLIHDGLWWIVYGVVGIAFPLMLVYPVKKHFNVLRVKLKEGKKK